jgi:hypothetical protein
VLIALTDMWRVEAVRRFAGSKANSPLAHTKPYASIRLPLAVLLFLTGVVVLASIRSLQFVPLPLVEACRRLWEAMRQPAQLEGKGWSIFSVLVFAVIGGLATALLLGRHSSDRRRVATLPIVLACCMALSLLSQFVQLYTGHTDLWQNQLLIQSLAALVGGAFWIFLAPILQRKAQRRPASHGAA